MQAAAQQTQEAQPTAQNVENARKWISIWRSQVAFSHVSSHNACSVSPYCVCSCKQASSAKASNAKMNGASINGSTSANQPGQATAPKAPGEVSPKAKPATKSGGFDNVNKYVCHISGIALHVLHAASYSCDSSWKKSAKRFLHCTQCQHASH